MSIVLQEAGEFIATNEKVYFAHNFALYFYKTTNVGKNITNSFHYISEEEYADCKVEDEREFLVYNNTIGLSEHTYNLETTNIFLPPNAIDDCIEKFHSMFHDAIMSAKALEELVHDS